jgi:hypothetical protein
MIQLLCDAFNCRSDAFYVLNPNPARAQQWAKDSAEGKNPSTLYQPKAAEPVNDIVEAQDEMFKVRTRVNLRPYGRRSLSPERSSKSKEHGFE